MVDVLGNILNLADGDLHPVELEVETSLFIVESFRQEMLTTRKELRAVQHNLRKDIERLGSWVKFINIALMPILLCIVGVGFGIYRRKKQ